MKPHTKMTPARPMAMVATVIKDRRLWRIKFLLATFQKIMIVSGIAFQPTLREQIVRQRDVKTCLADF